MLDHLSRGRVEFGTGIGVHGHEFMRWGVDYYQRAAIAGEVLELVNKPGPRMKSPTRASTSDSMRRCPAQAIPETVPAHLGCRAQRCCGRIRRQKQLPRLPEPGHRRGRGPQVRPLPPHLARATTQAPCPAFSCSGKCTWRKPTRRPTRRRDSSPPVRCESAEAASPRRASAGGHTCTAWAATVSAPTTRRVVRPRRRGTELRVQPRRRTRHRWGPETVIRTLEDGRQRIGYDLFCTNHEIGQIPKPLVRNSIELFGKEVIPAFR